MKLTILQSSSFHIAYAALQLCKKHKSENSVQKEEKTDLEQERLTQNARVISGRRAVVKTMRLARDRCAGNAADIGTIDAEVLQFAAGHATEFVNSLTELAPVVERACYVHDNPLS